MLETNDMPTFAGVREYSPEYSTLFKQWCKENNAFYYGKPKEDFNVFEARLLAKEAHASILLLDNMS